MNRFLAFVRRDDGADVLIVTNMWPEPDRPVYGIHVKRQIESLVAAGLRCDVLYLRGYLSPVAYPRTAATFLRTSLAWRRRYKVIHVYTAEAGLAARFHVGTPIVITYLGDDVLGDRRADGSISSRAALRARVIRAHSALFTRTITVSGAMESVLPRCVRGRNTVIPQGVNASLFRPLPRPEARAALGWPDGEHVALFAATKPESPAKRLWLAAEACVLASETVGPVRLHVVSGVDPETMPVLMSAADCLLVTSAVEGSPNVVKEALMCDLPVVSTRVGDVEELMVGVSPSWLLPPDRKQLAAALVECLGAPRRSNGRMTAARLREEVIAQRIVTVYRGMARIALGAGSPAAGGGSVDEAI